MKRILTVLAVCLLWIVPAQADNSARLAEVDSEIITLLVNIRRAEDRLIEVAAIKGELMRQDKRERALIKEAEKEAKEKADEEKVQD